MVRLNQDIRRIKLLEELQKEKEKTEEELEELEEKKKEELERLERRLEEAVAELISPSEEELEVAEQKRQELLWPDRDEDEDEDSEEQSDEDTEGEPPDDVEEILASEGLEERVIRERREVSPGEGGDIYQIESSELEVMPEMYDAVQRGEPDAVQQAEELLYKLNQPDREMTERAQFLFDLDREGPQYTERLSSVLQEMDQSTDRGTYQNNSQPDHV